MADYYSLLAKAVAGLPNKTSPQARNAIYERARKALLGQLRSIQPPLAVADIEREERALNEAIERLDADYAGAPPPKPSPAPTPSSAPPTTGAPTAAPPPAAPPPSAPKPFVPAPKPFVRSTATTRPAPSAKADTAPSAVPSPDATAAPEAAVVATSPVVASIAAPVARRPFIGTGTLTAGSSACTVAVRPPVVAAPARVAAAPHVSAAPLPEADSGAPPPIVFAPEPSASAPSIRANGDRPAAPGLVEPSRRGPWLFIVAAVVLIIVVAIAAVAFLHKETPPELAVKEPAADTAAKQEAPAGKIAERVTAAAPEGVTTDNPIPTVAVPVAPVHSGDAAPAPAAPPAQTAQNGQTPAPATQAPAAPSSAVSTPGRAALLVEVPGDGQKPRVALGTAVWSFIPIPQVGGPSLRVDVEIPDFKMHASVTIRKNSDASLPATHTIDVRAAFGEGSEFTGFKDMGLPQMRKDDTPSGDTLAGVRVKINDNYFLVGLTRSDTDAARNLDLIATRNWFDFPILMNNDRVAKLTIEKGADGIAAVNKALEAWK